MNLARWITAALEHHEQWQATYGEFDVAPSVEVGDDLLGPPFAELFSRLEHNYPFFHPRYAGQMLKPPHPVAVASYLAAMLVNPNNHALDGGPATAEMEVEAVTQLAGMFGFGSHLGHLTSSGTVANLEALFVARETHPGRAIAFSSEAHYTHARMCHLLGVEGIAISTDSSGRIDLDHVEALARSGSIGTVVMTAGSTALGAVDRVDEVLSLKDRYGLRVHVDGAYGGFYAMVGRDREWAGSLGIDPAPWGAIASCDSVVVDPHKHGLQPYGCGAVLFSDPGVARHYTHDSPYTYYTAERSLHLGEISLECSRAGAAAAAFWLTLRVFPLGREGLGRVLSATRRAALSWAALVDASDSLSLYQRPELDIVAYFPERDPHRGLAAVDRASGRVFAEAMTGSDPVFLSLLRVQAGEMVRRHPRFADAAGRAGTTGATGAGAAGLDEPAEVRILRSVLMKPESEAWAPALVSQLTEIASASLD
ncbi:MAG: aminotransferase class I/II-fold pyridoxal phosphate-dependent enzyme [Acidimicrobiales bacterium]|jgi:glutamate/tyrosine decarboxylase-like PLP-dependent enzyme